MKSKEKAKELVKKFMSIDSDSEQFDGFKMGFFYAQRCALIAVDEVLQYSKAHGFIELTEYYQEIKQEIEQL